MKHAGAVGMVGLGRMGANMARRLARGGARVVVWDRAAAARPETPVRSIRQELAI